MNAGPQGLLLSYIHKVVWVLLLFAVWTLTMGVMRSRDARRAAEHRLARRLRLRRMQAKRPGAAPVSDADPALGSGAHD